MNSMTEEQRKLAEDNLGLADYVVRQFYKSERRGYGCGYSELLQAARLGLCRAAMKYNPRRGVLFATCAEKWIAGSVMEHLRWLAPAGTRRSNRKVDIPIVASLDRLVDEGDDFVECKSEKRIREFLFWDDIDSYLYGDIEREMVDWLSQGRRTTLREIGERHGITASRASQRKDKFLESLRRRIANRGYTTPEQFEWKEKG